MTILKIYNDKGEEMSNENTQIREENFERYVQQYGEERAQGYRDAMNDILATFEYICMHKQSIHSERGELKDVIEYKNTLTVTKKRANAYYENQKALCSFLNIKLQSDFKIEAPS